MKNIISNKNILKIKIEKKETKFGTKFDEQRVRTVGRKKSWKRTSRAKF
jgi:hypothetical protein